MSITCNPGGWVGGGGDGVEGLVGAWCGGVGGGMVWRGWWGHGVEGLVGNRVGMGRLEWV